MCAALLTSHVELESQMNRMNTCDMMALYQVSLKAMAGTTLGMIKHKMSFRATKCLAKNETGI